MGITEVDSRKRDGRQGFEPHCEDFSADADASFILPASLDLLYKPFEEELAAEGVPNSDPYRSRTVETEQMHRNGSRLWVELKISFMRDADLKSIGILGFSRDITNRKRVEDALSKSDERYRDLMEDAPVGSCIVDTAGWIQYINKKIEDVSGYSRDDLLGLNGFDKDIFFTEDSLRTLFERLKVRLAGGIPRPNSIELQATCRDGSSIWIEMHTKIIIKDNVPAGAQLVQRTQGNDRCDQQTRPGNDL